VWPLSCRIPLWVICPPSFVRVPACERQDDCSLPLVKQSHSPSPVVAAAVGTTRVFFSRRGFADSRSVSTTSRGPWWGKGGGGVCAQSIRHASSGYGMVGSG
jgi:hypothetical protein